MEKRLITFGKIPRWMAVGLILAEWLTSCVAENPKPIPKPVTTDTSAAAVIDAKESARLAARILALKELPLPDAWNSAKGETLAARFDATSKAMRTTDPKAPSGPELMARFNNGGKPFKHSIWLNRPLFCPICATTGGDGRHTVMSVQRECVTVVSAGELHAVVAHGAVFPPAKLVVLAKILNESKSH